MIKNREGEDQNGEEEVEDEDKKLSKSQKVIIMDHFKKIDKHQDAGKDRSGKIIQVEHSVVDFRYLILGEKIRNPKMELEFNDLYLSKLILDTPTDEFFEQETVQRIIDFQFQKTFRIANIAFWTYLIGFVLPFAVTVVYTHKNVKDFVHTSVFSGDLEKLSYYVCLLTQLLFFGVEVVQLKIVGKDYLRDPWNAFDFTQFFLFLLLMLFDNHQFFSDDHFYIQNFMMVLLQLILIFEAFVKIQFFIRIYEQFGFLVQMIILTVIEVLPFTVYLMLWVGLFALSY